MEWQHLNTIKASMGYIEGLLKDMEDGMSGKREIYKSVRNDLSREQLAKVRDEIREIRSLLRQAKQEFNLKHSEFVLSQIINSDCSFIWESIEDLWSHKMEKSSGNISSKEKKERLDELLKQIYDHNKKIQGIIGK